MLVLCAGMYRACSTWQYEVVLELLRHRGDVQALGYLTGPEFASSGVARNASRGWAVVKSHEAYPDFTRLCRNQNAIVVYAHRDIRDVAYSLMHKMGVDFPALLRLGMIHQVLANDRYWRSRPRVLVQRYETLTAEPAQGIAALGNYLGLSLAPGEADELADRFSAESNRRRTAKLAESLRERGVDLSHPDNGMIYDAGSLLHWNHLRGGQRTGWRTQATSQERYILQRIAGTWLSANGYEPDPEANASLSSRERATLDRLCRRGARACLLRCAALRFPRLGGIAKRALGWETAPRSAVAAPHVAPAPSTRPVDPAVCDG